MSQFPERDTGFTPPKYTQIPDAILDGMGSRPYTETMLLLYIARRTFGFRKQQDAISYDQFLNGVTKRDGEHLDTGCGIKGRTTLANTIKSLEDQGLIVVERSSHGNEKQTTTYRLRLQGPEVVLEKDWGSTAPGLGSTGEGLQVVRLQDYRSPTAGLGVVLEKDIQETVQQTVLQQTVQETAPAENSAPHFYGAVPEMHSPASEETEPVQARDSSQKPIPLPPSQPTEIANGWTPEDLERLKGIVAKEYPSSGPKGGYRPSKRDLDDLSTMVPRARAKDFVAAVKHYAKKREDEDSRYTKGLRGFLADDYWEQFVAAPPRQKRRVISSTPYDRTSPTDILESLGIKAG